MQEQWQRFLVFVGIITFLLALIYSFIGMRLGIGVRGPWKATLWVSLGFFLVMSPVPFLFRIVRVSERVEQIISWISYLGFGFFGMLFTFLVVRDLGLAIADGGFAIIDKIRDSLADPAADENRRQFLVMSNAFLLGLTGTMFGYGVFVARRTMQIEKIKVPIKRLPSSLNGFRIVQITDVHVGPTIKKQFAEKIVQEVNALAPDLIAVTGDIVDGSLSQLKHHVAPFADFRAKHGTYLVTGNHEYYSGCLPWITEFKRLGMNVLLNEHIIIKHAGSEILLGGVTDIKAGDFYIDHDSSPKRAMTVHQSGNNGVSKTTNGEGIGARVLLAHQPRSVYEATEAGFDLQISGHTHAGQFFPGTWLVKLAQPYVKGLHLHAEKTWIYISRGTGYWGPPLRLGSPPEISVIELVSG